MKYTYASIDQNNDLPSNYAKFDQIEGFVSEEEVLEENDIVEEPEINDEVEIVEDVVTDVANVPPVTGDIESAPEEIVQELTEEEEKGSGITNKFLLLLIVIALIYLLLNR